jgi:hypothetical protein
MTTALMLDLLIILYQLHVEYAKRSGCRAKSVRFKPMYLIAPI